MTAAALLMAAAVAAAWLAAVESRRSVDSASARHRRCVSMLFEMSEAAFNVVWRDNLISFHKSGTAPSGQELESMSRAHVQHFFDTAGGDSLKALRRQFGGDKKIVALLVRDFDAKSIEALATMRMERDLDTGKSGVGSN